MGSVKLVFMPLLSHYLPDVSGSTDFRAVLNAAYLQQIEDANFDLEIVDGV